MAKIKNPYAYVPGGSSQAVSRAGQAAAQRKPKVVKPTFTASPSTAPTSTVTRTTPFDYDKWLAVDPTLQATLRAINAAGIGQQTALAGGAGQLYGRLGEMPENLSPELVKLLGPDQLAALRKTISEGNLAGTSTLARGLYDYRQLQSGTVGSLGARNMLRSSALGQHMNENLHALTLGQYDARQTAADALNKLQQDYLTNQATLAGQAGTAVTDAQTRASELVNAGQLGPYPVTSTVTNPYLNPAAPKQVSTPVRVGGTTSYEPRPTAGNYIPAAPTTVAPKPVVPKLAAPHRIGP